MSDSEMEQWRRRRPRQSTRNAETPDVWSGWVRAFKTKSNDSFGVNRSTQVAEDLKK